MGHMGHGSTVLWVTWVLGHLVMGNSGSCVHLGHNRHIWSFLSVPHHPRRRIWYGGRAWRHMRTALFGCWLWWDQSRSPTPHQRVQHAPAGHRNIWSRQRRRWRPATGRQTDGRNDRWPVTLDATTSIIQLLLLLLIGRPVTSTYVTTVYRRAIRLTLQRDDHHTGPL